MDFEELLISLSSPESGYESPERISSELTTDVRKLYTSFGREIGPHLEIVIQPQEYYRFRYLTEFKDNPHGPLTGENSTKSNKTFPTVKLNNYTRKAIIRCWLCVTANKEVHVHQLLTKSDGKGIRTEPHEIIVGTTNNFTATFEGLNIIHAVIKGKEYLQSFHRKKSHLQSGYILNEALLPLNFDEKSLKLEVKELEKNKAVLFFEAFDYETHTKIAEISSNEIKNSKNPKTSTLKISRQSHHCGKAKGGTEVFIFVEKVPKDIKIQFFELDENNKLCWEAYATKEDLWHQVAIAFRTPSYRDIDIQEDKKVYFRLIRESDGSLSNEMEFSYQPEYKNQPNYSEPIIGKKRRIEEISSNLPISYEGPIVNIESEILESSIGSMYGLQNSPYNFNLEVPGNFGDLDNFVDGFANLEGSEQLLGLSSFVERDLHMTVDPTICTDGVKVKKEAFDSSSTPDQEVINNLASLLFKYILQRNSRQFEETINKIEENKININEIRNPFMKTPIHVAIEIGNYEVLSPLLKAGIKINGVDIDKNSALHLSVIHDSPTHVVQQLLGAGADRSLKNYDGDAPIHLACRLKRNFILNSILNGDALEDKCKNAGDTPLHIAVKSGDKEMIELLLKRGAKVSMQNYANYTALDYAVQNEDEAIVKLLLSYMTSSKTNIYLVEIIMTKVQSDLIYELLENYMKKSEENIGLSRPGDVEKELISNMNKLCTLQVS